MGGNRAETFIDNLPIPIIQTEEDILDPKNSKDLLESLELSSESIDPGLEEACPETKNVYKIQRSPIEFYTHKNPRTEEWDYENPINMIDSEDSQYNKIRFASKTIVAKIKIFNQ